MSSPLPEPALHLPHPEPSPLPPPLPGAGINDPQWNLQKINAGGVTYGPAADADPAASVFSRQQHFGYRAGAGTIWDSWFDAPTDRWHLQQINADGGRTDGPMAFSGPFVWTIKNQQHFTYRDGKGVIWDSWYDGHWNLQQINAHGQTDGPPTFGDPFASVYKKQQHFAYRDREGVIWDSWYDGHWNLQQINAGGQTDGPPTAGDPFIWTVSNQQHFTYPDREGVIWDSWYDGHWNLQQINAGGRTVGPPTAGGPFVSVFGSQQHFAYRDREGVIWDSWYDGHWNLKNINAGGVTTGPAAVGGPFIWVDSRQQHFTYRDQEGTIWDSWFNGNPPPPASGSPSPTGLLRINAVSIIVDGTQIDEPMPGEAFNMCINVVNVGAGAALASTLTVEATSSDNSYSQTWTPPVPRINPGDGASVCIPVPALTAGITYDFNFYDPTTKYLGNESFAL
jgi:hypothetical protein